MLRHKELGSAVFVISFVFLFPLFFSCFGELEDEHLYPIIINTQADKAVFIVPELGCHIIQDVRMIQRVISTRQQLPHVYRTDNETLTELVDLCEWYHTDKINASQFVISLRTKSFLIFPGTRFCGAGNDAANYSDLGYYIETDKCCREHDFCLNFVDGWSCHPEIPELCNSSPFTRSHCSCDTRFRECLQRSNDTASVHIGLLYFTIFGLKCFREDYPIIECEEYGGFLNLHCQKYLLDESKEKAYQFFDSPKYSRGEIQIVVSNATNTTGEDANNSNNVTYKTSPMTSSII